jgi:predicted RNA binding protein YcfA (HicA-like mRNA interferase family)
MSKFDKLLVKLLFGSADKNFAFDDLVKVLLSLGFQMRTTAGSHHIFVKKGVVEIINIQPIGSKAKAYQVKQVRELIIKNKLWNNGKASE